MPRGNSEKSPGKMSKSAPTSPKNQHDLAKSSTLPTSRLADKGAISASTSGRSHSGPAPTTSESVSASPKKSRGATLTSFLKKLSPKLRPNASKGREKTWYVVEIAQKEGDAERVTTDLTARDGPHEDEGFTVSSNVCGSDPIKERHPHSGSGALGRNDTKNSQKLSNPHKGVEIQSGEKQSLLKGNSKKHLPDSNGKTNSSQQASNQMVTKASTSQKEEIKEKVQPVHTSFPAQPVIRINSSSTSPISDNNTQPGVRMRRLHQPPRTLNILNKIVVHPPEVEKVKGKMTSVESIGSCSLDVDATASEASDDGRTSSVSQRTLRSTSVELGSGSSGAQGQVAGTSHSPTKSLISTVSETTKGVATSTNEKRFISELYIPSGRMHTGPDRPEADNDLQRKLSYINLSCSVSGYTSYSCYNSKVREELRSRDNSPARFGVSLSNEQPNDLPTVNLEVTEDGVLKTMSNDKPTKLHTSSITLNVNSNGSDVVDRASRFSLYEEKSASVWRTSSEDGILNRYRQRTVVQTQEVQKCYNDSTNETVLQRTYNVASEIFDNNNNNDEDEISLQPNDSYSSKRESKSLIEQKIERLFGPGALAPGFRIHRERKQNERVRSETVSASPDSVVSKMKSPGLRGPSRPVGDRLNDLKTSNAATDIQPPTKQISSNGLPKQDKTADQLIIENIKGKSISTSLSVNGTNGKCPRDETNGTILNDHRRHGQWFIDVMNKEREKIKSLILKAEQILTSEHLSEDSAGRIRAAIGKANLLLSQKFIQFQGLCEKNLNQSGEDPFPTTVEDLEGFWDMVLIQVNDIYGMFEAIEKAHHQGWIWDDRDRLSTDSEKNKKLGDENRLASMPPVCDPPTKKLAVRKSKSSHSQMSSKSEEVAKAREEARRRLLEAKRRGRQQAATNSDNLGIEIYVPEEKE